MKKNGSIRNKLIRSIFIGCLLPFILGGAYLQFFIKEVLYEDCIENSYQILERVREQIDKNLIIDMEEELTMLASYVAVKEADQGINHYMDYNTDSFHYTTFEIEQSLARVFQYYKESHETTNFVFLATESGGYMEYPQFVPKESYDPRLRPWYINTINKEGIILSEPYITNVSNEMVISFTKRIDNSNETIGVIGVSVNLEDLTTEISRIKIGETGSVFVISQEGRFIVSPGNPDWILKTPAELGLDSFERIVNQRESSFEGQLKGKTCIFNCVESVESGLLVISAASVEEVFHMANSIINILIIIYISTFVIIILFIYFIANQITKPILDISSVIRRMTAFDFEDMASIKQYTKYTDEIGIVSDALVDMHDNYVELAGQINYIDDEIKNIDIKNNNQFKLTLSENNPFHGVVSSINILLDKTYMYFDQLRTKNNEILEKNELLVATEEELTAQLEEINQQKDFIHFLAYHDPLTELPNRRRFGELLTDKIKGGQRGAVILLDLDDFKGINDIKGHVFGDRVLEVIAKRFEEAVDERVFLSRFGGDEFLFLIEYGEDIKEIEDFASKISNLFYDRLRIDDYEIEIRYSMGIALFPEDSTDVDQLIMDADLAMYSVKNSGKNGYQFFNTEMMNYQLKISNIETILREAIRSDGFKIVYQPKIDLKTNRIIGYEGLLRLKNYTIPPVEFIPVAENNALIIQIGRIVTEKVICQLKEWQNMGLEIKPVSVNFSANQLHDAGYISFIQELLSRYDIDTKYLEIEITENIFLENTKVTLAFLKKLKQMGIKISIDDFGTGYSSLNYLTFLPVDNIKLDRSLNNKFLETKNDKVMDSLISLVHSLGFAVVAEGIEKPEQVATLKKAGCDMIQGYCFCRPIEAEQVPEIHTKVFGRD